MASFDKIQKILSLVYELNIKTEYDWFFDYSGHINSVSVYYLKTVKKKCRKCGDEKKTESVYLSHVTDCNLQTPLNNLIKELESYL